MCPGNVIKGDVNVLPQLTPAELQEDRCARVVLHQCAVGYFGQPTNITVSRIFQYLTEVQYSLFKSHIQNKTSFTTSNESDHLCLYVIH